MLKQIRLIRSHDVLINGWRNCHLCANEDVLLRVLLFSAQREQTFFGRSAAVQHADHVRWFASGTIATHRHAHAAQYDAHRQQHADRNAGDVMTAQLISAHQRPACTSIVTRTHICIQSELESESLRA